MSGLQIEKSTPLCLLQDGGRFGARHLGVTQGGAADWVSMSWANWLLGNSVDAAVVEIALGGFAVVSQGDCVLALAGADLGANIEGRPLLPWRAFTLRKGERLSFSGPQSRGDAPVGVRAYLAASGGFAADSVLGSRSTVARDAMGGLRGQGQALASGELLNPAGLGEVAIRELPAALIPRFAARPLLDVVIGAQMAAFSGQSLFDAFNSDWQVDARADRMGIRLLGPVLEYQGAPMISEGISLGSIQVPPDGQPIVLGNDRQTIGGYPRLGALTPLASARLAQCMPGETLRLRATVADSARGEHVRFMARFA
jgi:biotin-dependent carboxylase-like uncharacterized protein